VSKAAATGKPARSDCGILAIARNVPVPFSARCRSFGICNTEYRTAIDLTNRIYFFELTTCPDLIFAEFDLAPGAPMMELDADNPPLSGDVTAQFRTIDKAPFWGQDPLIPIASNDGDEPKLHPKWD